LYNLELIIKKTDHYAHTDKEVGRKYNHWG
jgi:hypothetical protein